ncbi:MAG: hypothetical protein Tsb0020_08840 [Haliangiales bacterium]
MRSLTITSRALAPTARHTLCAALALLATIALAAGCAEPQSDTCDDGLRCPMGTFCVGLDLCAVDGCGDGFLDPDAGELCDDGNNFSGDGCRADCRSDEVCGNGYIDEAVGELCDDGNTFSGDGCQADCQSIQTCGDGVIDVEAGEVCDDGNNVSGDGCRADCLSDEICGNGALDTATGEQCDDGNSDELDSCRSSCVMRAHIAAGSAHTCAVREGGVVHCWGSSSYGQLGVRTDEPIGDDERPEAIGPVALGAPAIEVVAGEEHTCALLASGAVRCWGRGDLGQLGVVTQQALVPATAVELGAPAVQIAAGAYHTCALLDSGEMRCWGQNASGQLGVDHRNNVSQPALESTVLLASGVTQVSAGGAHTCALLDSGAVQCWGTNGRGQLGLGYSEEVAEPGMPAIGSPIDFMGQAVNISAGSSHSCAVLTTGAVRCWGRNEEGELGYGHRAPIGDDEGVLVDVPLRGAVAQVAAGARHTCAVLSGGGLRCWGENRDGRLGLGHTDTIGDDEPVDDLEDVKLGGAVAQVALGGAHTCALLTTGAVRCWGQNGSGQLGLGERRPVGDDELPDAVAEVALGD